MITALGMYDPPALRAANDRYWQAIRNHLGHGPTALSRDREMWDIWMSPDLLLSQTCGYPYRAHLHGKVQLVGTPDFGLPDTPPGHYYSVFVTRVDHSAEILEDFAGSVFAFNEPLSQSGWAAPMIHAAGRVTFGTHLQTGAHAASTAAVAEGCADLTAIDAVTWRILSAHDPIAQSLRVVEQTAPTPGLPYITAPGSDAAALAQATRAAIADLTDSDRALLHLRDLISIPAEDYLSVPTPPAPQATAA